MSAPPAAKDLVRVPFLDLGATHLSLKDGLLRDFAELIDSSAFTNGPQVARFEEEFATWCGAGICVGLASGLDALRLAFLAAGIEEGDEVVLPANTFVASVEAVTQAGGVPVLVDVDEADYNMSVAETAAAIGTRTRFLLPVHLYGQLADMRALDALASSRGLELIEDACQAHGATRDGFRAGTGGLAGAFSFYPGKNLGAFGDAGALVTGDEALAGRVRALREHGQRRKYEHEREGWTARLDTIQAIVLSHKLPLLAEWNEARREAARYLSSSLENVGDLQLPPVAPGSDPVWHLYVVRTQDPMSLAAWLQERGVATGRHYPTPVHLTEAYRYLGQGPGSFPVSEALARECLSLPLFPGITEQQLAAVVAGIETYFSRG